ncbi:hypothetical protein LshimejAT787_0700700 [Lyophyllum shimeji]|uniref:Uncharacterized protein n=1 Tax=Lyophyllum shimeji TaxID=47721 RepID=A0A9P3PPA9_LYOSH|nr:hypothetical protein LshimejAT787_0700700 [Lyophyllum shimeji]
MSTRVFLLAITLLARTALVRAATDDLDPQCPAPTLPGFESNVFQYNVPAEQFFNKTPSFFHTEWYTGPVNSTHGKDDTIGSTRSVIFGGAFYTERLVAFSRSPSEIMYRVVLDTPTFFTNITFTSYTDELRIMSICGGSATYVSMTVTYCTDHLLRAYDGYDRYRRATVRALADELKAFVFTESCPNGSSQ